jgi:glucose-6-phosphate 1-dehydrogenase
MSASASDALVFFGATGDLAKASFRRAMQRPHRR